MRNFTGKSLLSAGLALVFACGSAWAAEHHGDADKKTEIPDTVDGIFAEVTEHLEMLEKTVTDKKLDAVHELAFEIRDLLLALPDKTKDLASDKKTALADALKKIKQEAGLLDKYGDAGDATQTKSVLGKFKTDIEAIRKLVGAKEVSAAAAPDHDIKLANNALCPISGKPVGSMEKDAHVDYEGNRVGLCCMGCAAKFMQNPDANLQKALGDKAGK